MDSTLEGRAMVDWRRRCRCERRSAHSPSGVRFAGWLPRRAHIRCPLCRRRRDVQLVNAATAHLFLPLITQRGGDGVQPLSSISSRRRRRLVAPSRFTSSAAVAIGVCASWRSPPGPPPRYQRGGQRPEPAASDRSFRRSALRHTAIVTVKDWCRWI